MTESSIEVAVADESHICIIPDILDAIFEASKVPGNSIVMRDPDYLAQKMREGKAVIAMHEGRFAGFCYIEVWQNGEFVANSGLIVKPEFRGHGLATKIKQLIFETSRKLFPQAGVFGITKSEAVIKMNTRLGYKAVPYSEITSDPAFWKGCDTCRHYQQLLDNDFQSCQCVAMLYKV